MNSDNPLNIAAETIHQDIRMDSEEDDDDMLSSAGSYDDDDGLMTSGMTQDEVTAQLAAAGGARWDSWEVGGGGVDHPPLASCQLCRADAHVCVDGPARCVCVGGGD